MLILLLLVTTATTSVCVDLDPACDAFLGGTIADMQHDIDSLQIDLDAERAKRIVAELEIEAATSSIAEAIAGEVQTVETGLATWIWACLIVGAVAAGTAVGYGLGRLPP